jgi:hypothetical protein
LEDSSQHCVCRGLEALSSAAPITRPRKHRRLHQVILVASLLTYWSLAACVLALGAY